MEDSSNSFYDNYEKFAFKSAPDEALFLRVLDRLKTLKEKHPTFTFIKTVSTHSPFINPDNKKSSEEKTFKYSDKEIGKFYSQLQKQNFFDDGIMIILGDHRKMATLLKEEVDKFGSINAKSQVPLILISKNKKPKAIILVHLYGMPAKIDQIAAISKKYNISLIEEPPNLSFFLCLINR